MKRAVIMGATSGMGWEVAKILYDKGWTLGVAGRREEKLQELCKVCLEQRGLKSSESQNSASNSSATNISASNSAAQSCKSQKIEYKVIDIENENAPQLLSELIDKIGGMSLYFHASGVGWQNQELDAEKDLKTCSINVLGFTRMVDAAWHYFKSIQQSALEQAENLSTQSSGGIAEDKSRSAHIAVISSIAGTKGLGAAAAYSASKSFDNTYIQALAQLTRKTYLNGNRNQKSSSQKEKHLTGNVRLKISFTDIRPGFVDTPLLDTAKHRYPMLMNTEKVARKIVRAIERKRRTAIIDFRYRILVFLWRLIPGFVWEKMKI